MTLTILEADVAGIASKFINHTGKHIFLTGKAGTGKTTFLKRIVKQTHKKTVIVAPTGIAAINAGGVTIHSLFQLPFGSFIPVNQAFQEFYPNMKVNTPLSLIKTMQMNESKRKILREIELLIIDEVSMLRADLLDAMDTILRHVRKHNYPFGGVQVLFIGDLLQLPPVVKEDEWQMLRHHYNSVYFFDAKALQHEKPLYIELEKIYRQADDKFISLLNNLRNNQINKDDVELLNKHYKENFRPQADENYITLTTHNSKADQINQQLLKELKGKLYSFTASVSGEFSEYGFPVERTLELKNGAQIMFVKNDPTGAQRFFNGKIGIISDISDDHIEVQLENESKAIRVEKYEWENVKYSLNETTNEIEENVAGTFTQYPIKLAWAITVHKSQGLTFEKAIIDVGSAFAAGQVYVALSRLKSLDGLVLKSRVNLNSIQPDIKLIEYTNTKAQQDLLQELIQKETLTFFKNYLFKSFSFEKTLEILSRHAENLGKEEKVSLNYSDWAFQLRNDFDSVKTHGDNFLYQLHQIFEKKQPGYLETLHQRCIAAKQYFTPIFKGFSNRIFDHIEEVKQKHSKAKTYCNELLELEVSFYSQEIQIAKSVAFAEMILSDKEFTSEDVKVSVDEERQAKIKRAYTLPEKKEIPKKEIKEKTKKAAKTKGESPAETFKLFKQGMSLEAIAESREMAVSTIEGHIVQYVAKGKIKPQDLMPEKQLKMIVSTIKEFKTIHVGPLKELLNDKASYFEIKIAVVVYLRDLDG